MCHQWREGDIGWMGFGGSVNVFNPERKIAYAYVPSMINMLEIFAHKSSELENILK